MVDLAKGHVSAMKYLDKFKGCRVMHPSLALTISLHVRVTSLESELLDASRA